jgi:hypothetical protein
MCSGRGVTIIGLDVHRDFETLGREDRFIFPSRAGEDTQAPVTSPGQQVEEGRPVGRKNSLLKAEAARETATLTHSSPEGGQIHLPAEGLRLSEGWKPAGEAAQAVAGLAKLLPHPGARLRAVELDEQDRALLPQKCPHA